MENFELVSKQFYFLSTQQHNYTDKLHFSLDTEGVSVKRLTHTLTTLCNI